MTPAGARARQLARLVRRRLRHAHADHLWHTAYRHYRASFPLTDRPALILAPHYDDETLGCGGLIARKRECGAEVRVLFVTDGRRCFGLEYDAPERLEAMRRQEAGDALVHLGVGPAAIRHLGFPDGELSRLAASSREQLIGCLKEAMESLPNAEVYIPHRRDRHPDHEALAALAKTAQDRRGERLPPLIEYVVWYFWEAPLWGGASSERSDDLAGAAWLDIAAAAERKRAAIAAYRSQHAVLPPGFLAAHRRPVELFVRRGCPEDAAPITSAL